MRSTCESVGKAENWTFVFFHSLLDRQCVQGDPYFSQNTNTPYKEIRKYGEDPVNSTIVTGYRLFVE